MLWSVCYLIFQSAHSFIPSFIDTHRHTALWTLLHIRVLLLLSLNIDFPVLPFYTTVYTNTDMTARQISFLLVWADERISQHLRALQQARKFDPEVRKLDQKLLSLKLQIVLSNASEGKWGRYSTDYKCSHWNRAFLTQKNRLEKFELFLGFHL